MALLPERHLELVHPFLGVLLDDEPHLLEQLEHLPVLHQHCRGEAEESALPCQIGDIGKQFRADALALVFVTHHERHFGRVCFLIDQILRHAHDRFPLFLRDHGEDHHLFGVVDRHKRLETLVVHVRA